MKLSQVPIVNVAPKATKAPKAGRTFKGSNSDTPAADIDISVPEDRLERLVFLLIMSLSIQGHKAGFTRKGSDTVEHSHVVPWKFGDHSLARALDETGLRQDLVEAGMNTTEIVDQLVAGKFVKRAGNVGIIPMCFDEPFVKGRKAHKSERGSDLRRQLEAQADAMIDSIDNAKTA